MTAVPPWGEPPAPWPTGEVVRFATVNGYALAYVEAGERLPALVLVHGSLSDARSFQAQVAPLSAHARVVAASLRHCHPERWDGRGDDFSVEQHAADVAALVDALALGPVHLLGHSRGGAVVLQAALRHPEVVRSLVLADPGGLEALLPPTPEGEAMARQTAEMFARLEGNLSAGDDVAAARRFVEDLDGPGAWERRTPAVRRAMLDNIRTGPACARRPTFDPDDLASLAVPILPITGERSPARYASMLARLREINARAAPVVTIAGAAHAMHREQPEAFNAAVAAFIAAH
ncbi:MAG: alpha/beta hydrolase [Betaproteobacteria bacterium]|nr:MAG: alpha/beta hydrolase [Betaproteobacteria bacterium]